MALQDVCGFLDTSHDLQGNALCLWSRSVENTFCVGGSKTRWLQETRNSSPLEFYVPVHEYLTRSPISFGQAQPSLDNSPWTSNTNGHCHQSSLSLSSYSIPQSGSPSVPLPFPLGHGTTTLGFIFQGGVIAAADSRSSCAGLVSSPKSEKIIPVHSHLVGTTSGTSADCVVWKRILTRELRLYQLRNRRRLSTGGAAKLLSHMLHPFKGTELCVAATLCGWDGDEKESKPCTSDKAAYSRTMAERDVSTSAVDTEGKPQTTIREPFQNNPQTQPTAIATSTTTKRSSPGLVYVCSDGLCLKGELFSVGSGSPYAYSILDQGIHWGMSVEEAVSVAREAVYRATHRDAYSGNNVDLYHVTAKGWTRRKREDIKEEYYREKERERRRIEDRKKESERERDRERGSEAI